MTHFNWPECAFSTTTRRIYAACLLYATSLYRILRLPGRLIWVIQHLLDIHQTLIFIIFHEHPFMFRSYPKLTPLDIHYSPLSYAYIQVDQNQPNEISCFNFFLFYPISSTSILCCLPVLLLVPTFTCQKIIEGALKSPLLFYFPFLFISFILPTMFQPINNKKKYNNLGLPPKPLSLEELVDEQEPLVMGAC
jgi:hypothetical protein